uniref:Uncharacterized protein n=1 Tax=Staphylococcus aureus TaxID=1280 RepID=D2JLC6_STAAU|nr:hypothetical protein SAP090A_038 [Staphylococcus aureus]
MVFKGRYYEILQRNMYSNVGDFLQFVNFQTIESMGTRA